MTKETIMKSIGVASILIGSSLLFISGAGAEPVTALVGGVFILLSLISAFFKA